jgi:hypothetical protein
VPKHVGAKAQRNKYLDAFVGHFMNIYMGESNVKNFKLYCMLLLLHKVTHTCDSGTPTFLTYETCLYRFGNPPFEGGRVVRPQLLQKVNTWKIHTFMLRVVFELMTPALEKQNTVKAA